MKLIESIRSWLMPSAPVSWFMGYNNNPITVTPENSLRFTPVYRAVNLISNDIARTPFITDSGVVANPNQYQTSFEFWRSMMFTVLMHGNSFAVINRDGFGNAVELMPVDPYAVTLQTDRSGIKYMVKNIGPVDPKDILHLRFASQNGLWGDSPVGVCGNAVSLGITQETFLLNLATNGGGAGLAISHPRNIGEDARRAMAEEYRANHSGPKNAGKPLILAEDSKVYQINSAASDPGVQAARLYSVHDVGRIFGIPSSLLGEVGTAVYNSLEALNRSYYDHCLSHWFSQIQAEIQFKLGAEISFDTDLFTKPPLAELMSSLRTGIEAGVLTQNEARDFLDMDPVEGGDNFLIAKNLGQGGGQTNLGTDTSQGTAEGDHK